MPKLRNLSAIAAKWREEGEPVDEPLGNLDDWLERIMNDPFGEDD